MKDLVEIYRGNLAEALHIKASLNDKGINPIIYDQINSANIAGFGIPNYMHSHIVYIHNDQLDEFNLLNNKESDDEIK